MYVFDSGKFMLSISLSSLCYFDFVGKIFIKSSFIIDKPVIEQVDARYIAHFIWLVNLT